MNTTHEETTALQTVSGSQVDAPRINAGALMMDIPTMESLMRVANLMASGKSTIPKHLQENPADCMAVAMQSMQWGMNPFAVAQKTHLVGGTLGYEAQLVNAVVQESGAISGRFHYEFKGAAGAIECRVGAKIKGEDEVTWGEWLNENKVTTKNSPLWKTNPKQQMGYLQVKNWARLHTPGAILGVYTPDEFDTPAPRNMGRADVIKAEVPEELVLAAEAAASKGVAAYQEFWAATGQGNRKLLVDHHPGLKQAASDADKDRTVDTAAPAGAPAAQPAAEPDAPTVTYAKVMEMMLSAEKKKDVDALDIAADWIGDVSDPAQRAELVAKYEALHAEMHSS
ncbi:MAG: RecT family recombinase [Rhodoferax sp.]|nr:RecT family recombinase [Rhodoferax sp.]